MVPGAEQPERPCRRAGTAAPASRRGRASRRGAGRARRSAPPRARRPPIRIRSPGRVGIGPSVEGDVAAGEARVDRPAQHLGRRLEVVERLHGHVAVLRAVVAVADQADARLGLDRRRPTSSAACGRGRGGWRRRGRSRATVRSTCGRDRPVARSMIGGHGATSVTRRRPCSATSRTRATRCSGSSRGSVSATCGCRARPPAPTCSASSGTSPTWRSATSDRRSAASGPTPTTRSSCPTTDYDADPQADWWVPAVGPGGGGRRLLPVGVGLQRRDGRRAPARRCAGRSRGGPADAPRRHAAPDPRPRHRRPTRHAGHADILREGIDGAAGLEVDVTNMPEVDWPAYVNRLTERRRGVPGLTSSLYRTIWSDTFGEARMTTTWQLPETARGWVTDGGLETDLIFHRGLDLPDFASFPLLDDPAGREVLGGLLPRVRRRGGPRRRPACCSRRRPGGRTPTGAPGSATTPRRSHRVNRDAVDAPARARGGGARRGRRRARRRGGGAAR